MSPFLFRCRHATSFITGWNIPCLCRTRKKGMMHSRLRFGVDRIRLPRCRQPVFVSAAAAHAGRLSSTITSQSNSHFTVASRWASTAVIMTVFGRFLNAGMSSCSSLSSIYILIDQQSCPVTSYSASQLMTARIIYASWARRRIRP